MLKANTKISSLYLHNQTPTLYIQEQYSSLKRNFPDYPWRNTGIFYDGKVLESVSHKCTFSAVPFKMSEGLYHKYQLLLLV